MVQKKYDYNGAVRTKIEKLKSLRAEIRGLRLFSVKYSAYLSSGSSSTHDLVGLSPESKNMMSEHLVHLLADIDNLETYINGKIMLFDNYEEFPYEEK